MLIDTIKKENMLALKNKDENKRAVYSILINKYMLLGYELKAKGQEIKDDDLLKTIKLQKDEIKTPVMQATARYPLSPPKGTATGVLLWIRRTETMQLDVDISMTLKGEQEQYQTMQKKTTAPVGDGLVEDEFIFDTIEPKENIVVKLSMTKQNDKDAVTLITGVFN